MLQTLFDALRCFGPIVAVMTIGIWLLNRLDASWQAEVRKRQERSGTKTSVPIVHCWEIIECSSERRETCPAYQNPDTVCWQHFRAQNGQLHRSCLDCVVFREAPVPQASAEL